jgi:hypothetical protein
VESEDRIGREAIERIALDMIKARLDRETILRRAPPMCVTLGRDDTDVPGKQRGSYQSV